MPINVLVADDSVTMRKIMEFTLAGEDVKVTSVDSGDACIAKASQLRPDVIYADVTMSTDGYAVAHAIRNTTGLENTAIVVLASQKHPYDEARGRVAGVDAHLVKPFDTQQAIDQFRGLASQPRAVAMGGPSGAAAAAVPAPAPRMAKTQTIAFGKAPLPLPPMMQPAAMAPAQQHAAPPPLAPQRASTAHAPIPNVPLQPLAPMQAPQRTSVAHPAPAPVQPMQAAPRSQAYSMGGGDGRAAAVSGVAAGAASDLASKLDGLGLNPDQIEGVLALSREVIERVVWEVVPDLAETIIREELKRLTQ